MNKLNKILLMAAVLLIIAFSFHIIRPYDTVRSTADFQGDRGIGFGSSDGTYSPSTHEQGESSQVGTTSYRDFFGTGSSGESSYGDFYESGSGGESSYGDFFDSDSGSESSSESGGDGGDSGGDSGDDGGGDSGDDGDW
jgi:hypothetical protein